MPVYLLSRFCTLSTVHIPKTVVSNSNNNVSENDNFPKNACMHETERHGVTKHILVLSQFFYFRCMSVFRMVKAYCCLRVWHICSPHIHGISQIHIIRICCWPYLLHLGPHKLAVYLLLDHVV